MAAPFADFIIYVDESGDHSLTSIDRDFTVFALAFCIVAKSDYVNKITPDMQALKFKYWGHDAVVLHEREIRKETGEFAFLRADRTIRNAFYDDLHSVMVNAPMTVIASVIDKMALRKKYDKPWNPYEIALHFCLERLLTFLIKKGQSGKQVHIIFECRGKAEDAELELAFRRIVGGRSAWGWVASDFSAIDFVPKFSKKTENLVGLQLADLVARLVALNTIRPSQPNRAFAVIATKLGSIKEFP